MGPLYLFILGVDRVVEKVVHSSKAIPSVSSESGYILGVDNFYSSPELFEILLENKTDTVGTVRFNKKMLSQEVLSKALKKDATIVQYKHMMMHMKYKDKNMVTC